MIGGSHLKFSLTRTPFDDLETVQVGADETAQARELIDRGDTFIVRVVDADKGELAAYAVAGADVDDMLVIYMARSFMAGIGGMALRGLFGGAQVLGSPMRVHTDKLRAFAKMAGAADALETLDADGVRMGVFNGIA